MYKLWNKKFFLSVTYGRTYRQSDSKRSSAPKKLSLEQGAPGDNM